MSFHASPNPIGDVRILMGDQLAHQDLEQRIGVVAALICLAGHATFCLSSSYP